MGVKRGHTRFAGLLVMASLGAAPGCMSCFNSVAGPRPDWVASCCAIPSMERNHVYIFLMNGLDPVNCCNLTGVRDCVQKLGFIKTYYGQPFHYDWFAAEIRRLDGEDLDARFVLIGSQLGANVMCKLARELDCDGVTIDLAFYLDGGMLSAKETGQPGNILQTVHVWSGNALLKGKHVAGADNICIDNASAFGCGPHEETLERLAIELAVVAASIPIQSGPAEPEQAPMPRPAPPSLPVVSEEWSFLQPRSHAAEIPRPKKTEPPVINAPKGRNTSAQGNALGSGNRQSASKP